LLWSLPLRGLEPATTAAQLAAVRSELEAMPQLQDSCVELVPDAGGFQLHVAGQWDVAISKADVLLLREQLLLRLLPILRELEQRDQERIS